MGSTRGIRLDAGEHSTAAAARMQPLDEVDRAILDWEYGLPGPHHDAVGIRLTEYEARVDAILVNPCAQHWAPESTSRLRARYGRYFG